MSFENEQLRTTFSAAGDLSAHQYRVVRLSGVMTVNLASLNTAKTAIGVLLNKPSAAGRAAAVAISGITKAYAGGTVTAAQLVTHDASGQVITAISGSMVLGHALESGAANDLIGIRLYPYFSGDTA